MKATARAELSAHPLVSDIEGAIKKVFVNLRSPKTFCFQAELDLVQTIAANTPDIEIVAGVNRDNFEVTRAEINRRGLTNIGVHATDHIAWARDIGLWADEGGTFILPRLTVARASGYYGAAKLLEPIPELVAETAQLLGVQKVVISEFTFDGGDVLPLHDKVFMSAKCLNQGGPVRTQAERLFERSVVCLGDIRREVPIPHLDFGATFLTDRVALINDPLTLRELLSALSHQDILNWAEEITTWKESSRTYSPSLHSEKLKSLDLLEGLLAATRNLDSVVMRRAILLAEVLEEQLNDAGVAVTKVPGINFGALPLSPINGVVDELAGKRRFFGLRVGCPLIDSSVANALTSTRVVDQFITPPLGWALLENHGGNRCVANVVRDRGRKGRSQAFEG